MRWLKRLVLGIGVLGVLGIIIASVNSASTASNTAAGSQSCSAPGIECPPPAKAAKTAFPNPPTDNGQPAAQPASAQSSSPDPSSSDQSSPPAQAGSAPDAMANWCSSYYPDIQAVENDNSTLETDSGNYDLASVESDGQQLEADAMKATSNPPPPGLSNTQAFNLKMGLAWMMVAGGKAAQGDITDSGTSLQHASADFNQVQGIFSC